MTVRGANYARVPLDHYPTPAEVSLALFRSVLLGPDIFDPACGPEQRIIKAARSVGLFAAGKDIIKGYDFLKDTGHFTRDLVTNPPYGGRSGKLSLQFIEHALETTKKNKRRVAMLLPVDFDSGKTRQHVFGHRAFAIKLVLLDRIKWFNNKSGSVNHAWFVWDWKNRDAPIIQYTYTRIYP